MQHMHEILQHVPPGGRVLDLGCREGSFPSVICPWASITRLDLERPARSSEDMFVQADAGRLPFRDNYFDAIIANHSLEHMVDLSGVLSEIGRVLKTSGSVYIAVPDSSTLSDRIYRWVYHGGGHINGFRSPDDIILPMRQILGGAPVTVRVLHTSFWFLDRRHFHPRPPRRLWIFLNGHYSVVAALSYLCRIIDRMIGSRFSVYGWAIYYCQSCGGVSGTPWLNVCVQCGSAHPAASLVSRVFVRQLMPIVKLYTCSACGAWNLFTNDVPS
jgi:SAM-dependent methyltransferase